MPDRPLYGVAAKEHDAVYDGILLNGAVTMSGGAAFLALAAREIQHRSSREDDARVLFLAFVGMHLTLAGARQFVAYGNLVPTALTARIPLDMVTLDHTLFLVTTVMGAFTVAPLAFLACESRAPRWSIHVGYLVSALTAFGLALFFASDLRGPIPSRWGSEWEVGSSLVNGFLGAAVAIPASLSVYILLRAPEAATRTFALAALVYYGAIVPDALGLTGLSFVLARVAAAGSSLVAWEAMRRPFAADAFLASAPSAPR